MKLIFVILVLCWSLPNSTSHPPIPEWRQSRFIIDNRRNALFSHYESADREDAARKKLSDFRYPSDQRKLIPPLRYQKDLSAEASIRESSFLDEYKDNSLPGGVTKIRVKLSDFGDGQKGNENARNVSRVVYDPHNLIRGVEPPESSTQVQTNAGWARKIQENVLESSTASEKPNDKSRISERRFAVEESTPRLSLGYGRTPWSVKPEEVNQIDDNEKHVYETRIETVSYHQEVIFKPPKPETNTEDWYQRDEEDEEATTYDRPGKVREGSYQPERNYEEPEKNYEEPEENYEEPERNYEEPERNYEEPEGNYEEPERNYEEPERNYEPESSYEGPERSYGPDETPRMTTEGKVYPPETDETKKQFGYVVEGQNFRKYRVEERTADGFIVGEYGVVSHDDGTLRGVRYTADSAANPQLIYDTLIKFLSL